MPSIHPSETIQTIPLQSLADEFGTPLYVYDAAIIDRQVNRLRSAFAEFPHQIKYAAKALTNTGVLRHMKSRGLGLDVVSIQELRMGLDAGFKPSEILFTSNSIHYSELKEAIKFGTFINIDSLSLLEKFGQEYGGSYPCSIRLRLDPLTHNHEGSKKWHQLSKFGIHHSRIAEIRALIKKYDLNITGLHVHNSSGFLDIPVYLSTADRMFSIAGQFGDLQFIDFGGGITIPFYRNHKVIDIEELGKKLAVKVNEFYKAYGSEPDIWFEPGRFLVSECGILLTTVTVLKEDREPIFAGTDTGFHHLLRPALYDSYHEIHNLSNPSGDLKGYHITGNMCETDFLGKNRTIAEIREGDILMIFNAGAYGSCMASNYNSRLRPAEVMVRDGKAHLIKRRETYEDLIRNHIAVDW